jgi:hypothetical protein
MINTAVVTAEKTRERISKFDLFVRARKGST